MPFRERAVLSLHSQAESGRADATLGPLAEAALVFTRWQNAKSRWTSSDKPGSRQERGG
jgi:hypothetical protein